MSATTVNHQAICTVSGKPINFHLDKYVKDSAGRYYLIEEIKDKRRKR